MAELYFLDSLINKWKKIQSVAKSHGDPLGEVEAKQIVKALQQSRDLLMKDLGIFHQGNKYVRNQPAEYYITENYTLNLKD